ncbi:uncharacterized protein LOC126560009 [Anopheles maculipalpis]|uniref:uncharacterized protein LOC126560009 n=1 Tax=Anopheles maculipalpis TaxID=1496333 RepID=UPI00215932DC|nr:uncharacterized protein LOC126560009 [Anopheles maculipalpis]
MHFSLVPVCNSVILSQIDLVDDDNNRVTVTANGKTKDTATDSVMMSNNSSNMIDDDTSSIHMETVSVTSLSTGNTLDSGLSMDVDEVTITPSNKSNDAAGDTSNTVIIQ